MINLSKKSLFTTCPWLERTHAEELIIKLELSRYVVLIMLVHYAIRDFNAVPWQILGSQFFSSGFFHIIMKGLCCTCNFHHRTCRAHSAFINSIKLSVHTSYFLSHPQYHYMYVVVWANWGTTIYFKAYTNVGLMHQVTDRQSFSTTRVKVLGFAGTNIDPNDDDIKWLVMKGGWYTSQSMSLNNIRMGVRIIHFKQCLIYIPQSLSTIKE